MLLHENPFLQTVLLTLGNFNSFCIFNLNCASMSGTLAVQNYFNPIKQISKLRWWLHITSLCYNYFTLSFLKIFKICCPYCYWNKRPTLCAPIRIILYLKTCKDCVFVFASVLKIYFLNGCVGTPQRREVSFLIKCVRLFVWVCVLCVCARAFNLKSIKTPFPF